MVRETLRLGLIFFVCAVFAAALLFGWVKGVIFVFDFLFPMDAKDVPERILPIIVMSLFMPGSLLAGYLRADATEHVWKNKQKRDDSRGV